MWAWGHLCTYVLTLLELGPSSSSSSPLAERDIGSVYAPEIFNPTRPNTKKVDNAYDSIYTTDNSCNGPNSRDEWCDGKSIHTDYEKIDLAPDTGKTNYVSTLN